MEQELIIHMKKQMVPDEQMVERLMVRLNEMQNGDTQIKDIASRQTNIVIRRAVVAVLIVAAGLFCFSPAGAALAEHVMEWLKPKNITQQIEGCGEEAELIPQYQAESEAEYVIYVDEEYFTSEFAGEQQIIRGVYNSDVQMTITHQKDISIEECMKQELLKNEITDYQAEEPLDIQLDNKGIWYAEGIEWDDVISHMYFIDDGKNGCYIAAYSNTVEAEEGYGSRLKIMLNTFELIEGLE